MERTKYFLDKYLLPYYILIYTGGIIGHLIPVMLPLMVIITPWFLFINTGLIILYIVLHKDFKLIVWVAGTIISTFFLEYIGITTGLVFGDYSYGSGLGIKLLNVPLVIGFNWVMVILGISELLRKYNWNIIYKTVLIGLIATLFDFYMEPSAVALDYWNWHTTIIPLKNYIDWSLTAVIFSALYYRLEIKTVVKPAMYYFILQFGFFAILYFAGYLL